MGILCEISTQILIKSGIGFGTRFDIGIYQKLLVVTIVALRSCQSCKLSWGTTRWGCIKTDEFVRPPNIRNAIMPAETKKTRNTIRSRVHRKSTRDNSPGPFW